jgi:tetratricopeptide (TPR) repeat protein
MYAGDFKKAAATAQVLIGENPAFETAYLPLAMEALASGDPARARSVYEKAAQAGAAGASIAAIGLADVSLYQGRYDEALAVLQDATQRDIAEKNAAGAVAKLLAQAEAHAARGQARPMVEALNKARSLGDDDSVLVPSARLAIGAGRIEQAKAIATELGKRLPPQSRSYGKLIEAEIDIDAKRYVAAIDALNEAQKLANLWLVRYALGHAYFLLGDFQAAMSEFEECQRRRGEATALFLDDLPTFRYYAPVPYWLGRAREMRGHPAREQYQEFLAIRGESTRDPLVVDAKRRLAAVGKQP